MMQRVQETRGPWILLGILASYLFVAVMLHDLRGAVHSGFGSFDDEPSHVVTGLMFRDYMAAGMPGSPLQYAEDYYLHYPKVGIGQWPPVFYVVQGVWMLAFGESSFSLIVLMSTLVAITSSAIFLTLRFTLGGFVAWGLGLLFLLMPLVQRLSSVVMTEVPLAMFCILAALQFGRFLDTERARNAMGFAFFAVLAILTKGNALALGLLPPLAIALSGRWYIYKRASLWVAGAIVAALAGPWYWFTLPMTAGTWAGGSSPSLSYSLEALPFYGAGLVTLGGVAVAALAVVGLWRPADPDHHGTWAAVLALLPAIIGFHIAIPSSIEARHLVLVAPAVVLLAGWGLLRVIGTPGARQGGGIARWAPTLLMLVFMLESFELPVKSNHGYRSAIHCILADPTLQNSTLMIASDSLGEGLFVAGLARSERRLGHILLRGSKVLGKTPWSGYTYEPVFDSPAQMMDFLHAIPVGVVALDLSCRERQWYPHHDILKDLLEDNPDVWTPMDSYDVMRDGVLYEDALRVYRQVGHETLPRGELSVAAMLGREVPEF